MAKVKVNRVMDGASVAEVEALWHDHARWTGFVDGFGSLERIEGDWPRSGAVAVWDSRPGGRGRVVERSVGYEPGAHLVCEIEDSELTGTQTTSFAATEGNTRVTLELDCRPKDGNPLTQAIQVLFVRGALKQSLRRTLQRFDRELTADRELSAPST